MMEPFAIQEPRRSRSPWITVVVLTAVFCVWHFDIIPRIRSAATGHIPQDQSAEVLDASSIEQLDVIVDRSDSENTNPEATAERDPLTQAIASTDPDDPAVDAEVATSEPSNDERINSGEIDTETAIPTHQTPAVTRAGSRGIHGSAEDGDDESPAEANESGIQQASLTIQEKPRSGSETNTPRVISAELAEKLRQIDQFYRDDRILEAHAELSRLYWNQPASRAILRSRIDHTANLIYGSPDVQFNEPCLVEYGDTLESIAKKHKISWQYLAMLNRTTPESLQAGQSLKIVEGPFSAVVDLHDFSMTIHAHGWYVHRYTIGTGKDNRTPIGEFTVQDKLENPVWYNPDGGVVEADDPENPLGEYWIGIGNHIGIHGTIDPDSIGQAQSRGCIHLADDDIEEVFNLLDIGSKVLIRK
ncbi:MAG: L,D-transpeptidase family protein [Planctomyces sp.]